MHNVQNINDTEEIEMVNKFKLKKKKKKEMVSSNFLLLMLMRGYVVSTELVVIHLGLVYGSNGLPNEFVVWCGCYNIIGS